MHQQYLKGETDVMKKKTKIVLSIIAIIIIGAGIGVYTVISTLQKNLDNLAQLPIEDVDLSGVADGTYVGSYEVLPVSAEVAVTVMDHKITAIDLVKHINGKGAGAEIIPDEVVKTGSLQVDTVSGATYSSKVILKAIENALKNE